VTFTSNAPGHFRLTGNVSEPRQFSDPSSCTTSSRPHREPVKSLLQVQNIRYGAGANYWSGRPASRNDSWASALMRARATKEAGVLARRRPGDAVSSASLPDYAATVAASQNQAQLRVARVAGQLFDTPARWARAPITTGS